jgi:hypothetical protein
MSFPGIGTTNPAHQLETTSNVTAESLEIYSDYTFLGSSQYNWARQLRLRVNTPGPSSSNVFVDMGLEKDDGTYFYISKPLSTGTNPKNNFRIYQDGRILINRANASRTDRLQVTGDVKVTGNLNVTGTTTVSGDVDITGNLHVTSFNQEQNYIVPVGMIVMWDGAVADIPPGWELVTDVSGYYLRSDPTQTIVQSGGETSNVINNIGAHTHTTTGSPATGESHNHNIYGLGNHGSNNTGHSHSRQGTTDTYTANRTHHHNWNHGYSGANTRNSAGNDHVVQGSNIKYTSTDTVYPGHTHGISYSVNSSGNHSHTINKSNFATQTETHSHNNLNSEGNVSSITINLTPSYREIRLIKKLVYT